MLTKNRDKQSDAVETVVIDREAYQRLEEVRNTGESFSELIKRCIRPRQTAEEILRVMRRARVSSSTLRALEESATRRRRIPHGTKG